MFIVEASYSLLPSHFPSTVHLSTCFHFVFYKADVRLCQDSFPLLPFKINTYFFPFSWLRRVSLMATQAAARPSMGMGKSWNPVLNTLQHLCCCHSLGAGQQSWQQPCRSTRSPLKPLVLLPHGAGSSPPHRQRQAGQQARLASGTEGRWGHRRDRKKWNIGPASSDTVSNPVTHALLVDSLSPQIRNSVALLL